MNEDLKGRLTDELLAEFREMREEGKVNVEILKPVLQTFVSLGIEDKHDLKGAVPENNLRWEGV